MLLSPAEWSFLLQGAGTTIRVTLLAFAVALVVAFIAGLALTSQRQTIRFISTFYIEIFRGSSAIVQIYFIFFVLPFFGIIIAPLWAGIVALGLNFGAYGAHIVRATIEDVDQGQWEAATALNMPRIQALRRIIFPQAVIAMTPLFGNELIRVLKATSLLSAVTIPELTFQGKLLVQHTGRTDVIYGILLLIYFSAALPLALAVRGLQSFLTRRYGLAAGVM